MIPIKDVNQSRLVRFLRKISVILTLAIVGWFPLSAYGFEILLGTGEPGSFSYFTGRMICRVINSHVDGVQCEPKPSSDDVYILTNIQGGSLDIGLVDSRMFQDAVNKMGYFEFLDIRYDNLRVLMPLYAVPVTLVARTDAGIASLNDLKGKRINMGAPRSPEHLAVETILNAKSWSETDFSLVQELSSSQSEDSMAFCHGIIQAMVHLGVHPDPKLEQLLNLCKAQLVDMVDGDIQSMIDAHAAFSKMSIPAGIYPSQNTPVTTFGTNVLLVTSQDFDEDSAYKLIDAIYRHQKRFKSAHPALSPLTVEAARNYNTRLPQHPGAVRYFSQH